MPNIRPQTEYSACDYRSDELAKEMLANIIGEKNFDIDDIEWDDSKVTVPEDLMSKWKTDVDPVTIEELTSRQAFGSGIFDALMQSVHNHLKIEYDKNRITGAEYATTYTKLTEAAMANAVQFCLQKNQAYFQGILAQAQAISAGIQAQIAAISAKVQLAKVKAEAMGVAAQYALTAMKLSTEDAQHALICRQQDVTTAQIAQTEAQTDLINAQVTTQGEQAALIHAQALGEAETTKLKTYQARLLNPDASDTKNLDYQLKQKQLADQTAQTELRELQLQASTPTNGNNDPHKNIDFLIKEAQLDQVEAQADVAEEQKNLYIKQADAYEHKWELDIATLYANQYTAMKSVDEGLALPKAFSGASINEVLQKAKARVNLGADNTDLTGNTLRNYLSKGILTGENADANTNS